MAISETSPWLRCWSLPAGVTHHLPTVPNAEQRCACGNDGSQGSRTQTPKDWAVMAPRQLRQRHGYSRPNLTFGEQVQRSTHRASPPIRIYNHMSDPPFFDTLLRVPLSCPPQLPRDVIRPQRQSQPKSGGVVQHDFHVPNVEGLFNYPSHFYPPSLTSLCFV
jgi:hypothetical protein